MAKGCPELSGCRKVSCTWAGSDGCCGASLGEGAVSNGGGEGWCLWLGMSRGGMSVLGKRVFGA